MPLDTDHPPETDELEKASFQHKFNVGTVHNITLSDALPNPSRFTEMPVARRETSYTEDEWVGAMHGLEVRDRKQQIQMRPWFAAGVFVLLAIQNAGIFHICLQALEHNVLDKLQFIFSTLIGGTLIQSYLILRFITDKVFTNITYPGNGKG